MTMRLVGTRARVKRTGAEVAWTHQRTINDLGPRINFYSHRYHTEILNKIFGYYVIRYIPSKIENHSQVIRAAKATARTKLEIRYLPKRKQSHFLFFVGAVNWITTNLYKSPLIRPIYPLMNPKLTPKLLIYYAYKQREQYEANARSIIQTYEY